MEQQISRILHLFKVPAFIASERAELLYQNDAMRRLTGMGEMDHSQSLIGLGIFNNSAEFRGFLRGFTSVGPLQRIRLPSKRLKNANREVTMLAVRLEDAQLIVGSIQIQDVAQKKPPSDTPNLDLIVDYLPNLVFRTDGEGNISYMNQLAQNTLQPEYSEKKTAFRYMEFDGEITKKQWGRFLKAAREKGQFSYETSFLRPDGKLMPVEVTISHVEGIPVRSATLVARDITQQRAQERDLQAAKLEIEQLQFQQRKEKVLLDDQLRDKAGLKSIVSQSENYQHVLEGIRQVAPTDVTVLIMGETGTGKELVARAIHEASRRSKEQLVTINCGALPKDLIESELFGYKKGAFTGAYRDKPGRFQLADGGTLFLDEIGELELNLQARLLRFLQEGEYTPLGGEIQYADVRIIAATNRDLVAMVNEAKFRADLFFRLNVFPINNPPLRDRKEDIPILIDHFIQKHSRRLNSQVKEVGAVFLEKCLKHSFPGNIRELENMVERAMITSPGRKLQLDWHFEASASPPSSGESLGIEEMELVPLDILQKAYIERVLRHTNGKVSGPGGAAEILGLKGQTLFSKIRKLKVRRWTVEED